MSHGKPLTVAILDGAGEVIQPLTVATLAICIVFFPVVMLFGVARYLFIPLAATVPGGGAETFLRCLAIERKRKYRMRPIPATTRNPRTPGAAWLAADAARTITGSLSP